MSTSRWSGCLMVACRRVRWCCSGAIMKSNIKSCFSLISFTCLLRTLWRQPCGRLVSCI